MNNLGSRSKSVESPVHLDRYFRGILYKGTWKNEQMPQLKFMLRREA